MRVVNHLEMKEIESKAYEEYGLSESLIIENVGQRAADYIQNLIENSNDHFNEVVFLIGNGHNGADGLSIARNLVNRGISIRAFLMFPENDLDSDDKKIEELKSQLVMAQNFGVKISTSSNTDTLNSYFNQTSDCFLVVDAILGTGFRQPLSDFYFDVVNIVNNHATITVSIDMPTGVTADNGNISNTAINADYTLAIGLPKTGHYLSSGAQHSGEIFTLDVGFPKALLTGGDKTLLVPEKVVSLYEQRDRFAHKNSFGHALVIGGSKGLSGALLMASQASLKVGTGLVTSITWKDNYEELYSRVIPEIMTGTLPTNEDEYNEHMQMLSRFDSCVVGPGMGRTQQTREIVLELIRSFNKPLVIDADAIKMISLKDDLEIISKRTAPLIFTPHLGEFSSFVGVPLAKISERPVDYLKEVVDKTNSCFILKGPCSFLGIPTNDIFLNYFPNDGMASGGSGDVLAGILGGLLAQIHHTDDKLMGPKTYQALCLGLTVHTLAGKYAAQESGVRSMTAGSIIDNLGNAFKEMKGWS